MVENRASLRKPTAQRKGQQQLHPSLTMTGMYNVLEKLRAGEELTAKERVIHEQGLVSVLRQIHDELDAAVADAYGWPHDLTDEQILERLVALNHERAAEEQRGLVCWLRPEFQCPGGAPATQPELALAEDEEGETEGRREGEQGKAKAKKLAWPKSLAERMRAVRTALAQAAGPLAADEVAAQFTRANKQHVAELLETLVDVGHARRTDDARFAL